jgi:hypothetical protein
MKLKQSLNVIAALFLSLSLCQSQAIEILDQWQVLMPDQRRYDFEVGANFCFAWDGISTPSVGIDAAMKAASESYDVAFRFKNPWKRLVKSVKLVRFDSGLAYYQILLGEAAQREAIGTTGVRVDIPVAVGKGAQVLAPKSVTMAWKDSDRPLKQYWQ